MQGLRALAVLLVIAYHAGLDLPGGFVGVDVFFVISGFVITRLLVRGLEASGRMSFGRFYARRIRRILPAVATMLLIVAVLAFGAVSPLKPKQTTAKTGIAAATFTANVYLDRNPKGYFDAGPDTNPFLHTWSLSVEEQFYLVFPALLAATWALGRRRRHSRRVTVAGLAVVGAGSFALCVAATRGIVLGPSFAFYMAPTRAWEFCAGALLVFLPAIRAPKLARTALAGAGLACVLIGAATIGASTAFPGTAALWPVLGTVLLVVAGGIGPNPFTGLLGRRPLTTIGDLSYSWYLWHWPLIVFAGAMWPGRHDLKVLAALASLGPAWLSYHLVEQRFRHDQRILGRRAMVLAGACVAVPVLACGMLGAVRIPVVRSDARARLAALTTRHADGLWGCDSRIALVYQVQRCTIAAATGDRDEVVLVGDSNAGQFTEPALRAAHDLGYRFVVSTYHGCRFADIDVVKTGGTDLACRRHVEATLDALVAHHPALVIIASSSSEIVTPPEVGLTDPATGRVTHRRSEKIRLWQRATDRVLRPLRTADIPVLLVDTIPQFPDWQPNCAAVRVYLAPTTCGVTTARTAIDRYRGPARTAEHAAARANGVATVDFADVMCDRSRCRTNIGDRWLYRDSFHLSVRASLGLTSRFRTLIGRHATERSDHATLAKVGP